MKQWIEIWNTQKKSGKDNYIYENGAGEKMVGEKMVGLL